MKIAAILVVVVVFLGAIAVKPTAPAAEVITLHQKCGRGCFSVASGARTLLAERLTPMEVSWGKGSVEDWSRTRLSVSVE